LERGCAHSVNWHRLEIANWVASGFALFAFAACLFISQLSTLLASALLLALGTSVAFTQMVIGLSADVLFIAGSCLLAVLIATYSANRRLSLWWLAAGVLTGLLYLVKTAAIAYIVGLGAFGFFNGDLRRLSRLVYFALPTASVVTLWFFLSRGIPTYGSFFSLSVSEMGVFPGYVLNAVRQAIFYFSGRWMVEAMLNVPDRLSEARAFRQFSFASQTLAFILGLAFAVPIFRGMRIRPKPVSEQMTLFLLAISVIQFILWPFYLGARAGRNRTHPISSNLAVEGTSFQVCPDGPFGDSHRGHTRECVAFVQNFPRSGNGFCAKPRRIAASSSVDQ
jgi:hypothetical protein